MPTGRPRGSVPRGRRAKLAFTAAAGLVALIVAEVGFRTLVRPRLGVHPKTYADLRAYVTGGGPARYAPHPYTLYTLSGRRDAVNSLGFRDREWSREATGLRIACLGASTTYGVDRSGAIGAYPHQLEGLLREQYGTSIEVMNWGMPGWTTAETLVNYFLNVQDFAPDVVILHHAVNDTGPRDRPGFRRDYAHYRKPWTPDAFALPTRVLASVSDLYLHHLLTRSSERLGIGRVVNHPLDGPNVFGRDGTLPLATADAFRRNVRTIAAHVEAGGGRAVLMTMPTKPGLESTVQFAAVQQHNEILRELADQHGFLLVDAARRVAESDFQRYFIDMVHLTPKGHALKARLLARSLGPELGY